MRKNHIKWDGGTGVARHLAVVVSLIVVIFSLYFVNIKPILAGSQLVESLRLIGERRDVNLILGSFEKVFAYNTFGTIEAKEQLSGFGNRVKNLDFSKADQSLAINKAIEEMEKLVDRVPNDLRYKLFLGNVYNKAGEYENAVAILNEGLELSPNKQAVYFSLGDTYIASGDMDKAFDVLETAYNLDPTYGEAARNLAIISILNEDDEFAEGILEESFGGKVIADEQLANTYLRMGNLVKVKEIWMLFVEKNPDNAQYHVNLAATYLELNERLKAIGELESAIELDPNFKDQGEFYINEIRAGRNP